MTAAVPLIHVQQPGAMHALQALRLSLAEWPQRASSQAALGGLAWGWPGAGAGTPSDLAALRGLAPLTMPLLGATSPWVDAWAGEGAPMRRGHSGAAHWQTDGDWAFGHLNLPEASGDLEATAYRAYLDLFAALQDCGCPQVLRLWNYLPCINADGGGLERYRQFNIGRQRAFVDAARDAFEGAPAACALGTPGESAGGLSICFLAGRVVPRPVDNPRQVPAYRYSTLYGPRAPSFSRATLADAGGGRLALLVSGTASIVGEHTVHLGDVRAQTQETLRNLQAVIDSAHRACSARLTLADLHPTVYVRHAVDRPKVLDVLAQAVPAWRTAPCVQADICRAELLVEIEAHALVPGALA
jgi:enamine deaminase RidA (YjgF/YER057c/UK114 family)